MVRVQYTYERSSIMNRGFSLVELMVSLTIFSIVMTISTGTLLVFIDGNAKAQSENTAITNLTFALDSMTRNIRMGRDFYCANQASSELEDAFEDSDTQGCENGGTGLVFTPGFQGDIRMGYRFNNSGDVIEQRVYDTSTSDDTGWLPITSTSQGDTGATGVTNIEKFNFVVSGTDPAVPPGSNDSKQPAISLAIEGTAGVDQGSVESRFRVQTYITQRVLDF